VLVLLLLLVWVDAGGALVVGDGWGGTVVAGALV
jgi:hypothetical protein